MKKYLWLSSAAVVIGALRVKSKPLFGRVLSLKEVNKYTCILLYSTYPLLLLQKKQSKGNYVKESLALCSQFCVFIWLIP